MVPRNCSVFEGCVSDNGGTDGDSSGVLVVVVEGWLSWVLCGGGIHFKNNLLNLKH